MKVAPATDVESTLTFYTLLRRKPVGKYNVWNKITRSEGTSH